MEPTAGLLLALRDPACFPGGADQVEVLQTHISIVCLAGDRVYKLKKPVRLPFLDFSTLPQRRHWCREEVRLNRRLCPDVYLGTAALRRRDGALAFAAVGDDDGPDDLDVAVVMRRLPADRMLDRLLATQSVTRAEIDDLARRLAAFHAGAARTAAVRAAGSPEHLAELIRGNFREVQALPDHGLPTRLLAALAAHGERDLAALLPALRRRATEDRIVDGHGDLHARNICLTTPPAIYDCLEFAPAFRCGDVATEIAFLAMDLRYRGAPALARQFVHTYVDTSGDRGLPGVLPPLLRYRAMVRGKVAALAAREPELPAADRDGARHSAFRHLLLAAATAIEEAGPRWLVLCGPPGSGKSVLAQHLHDATGWPVFATDTIRKELAGLAATARAPAECYTAAFTQRTYREVQRRAAAAKDTSVVILDGNFASPAQRADAAGAARAAGASAVTLLVEVPESVGRQRVTTRAEDPDRISDAGAALYDTLHRRFQPPTAAEGLAIVRLDGELPPRELAAAALTALLPTDPPPAPALAVP